MRVSQHLSRITHHWQRLSGLHRGLIIGLTAIVVVTVALVVAFFPRSEPPRARQYLAVKACLLTGPEGLADKKVAPVWAGMQKASLETRAKVQYLSVAGPATVANAAPFLGTLVTLDCDVMVAAGDLPVATVAEHAGRYADRRFIVVGPRSGRPNVTAVDVPDDQITAKIADLVTDLVNDEKKD